MPGLIGLIRDGSYSLNDFNKAKELFISDKNITQDKVFEDSYIIASRCHLGIIGNQTSPYYHKHLRLWIEGEIYNQQHANINTSICDAYLNNRLESFLNRIDGYYCAVLYDLKQGLVLIWTDRYGIKPIYYNEVNFAWSSELKAFKYLNSKNKKLDFNAINNYLALGHFIGNTTYFEKIKLVSASTIIKYSIKTKELTQKRYWGWFEIKQLPKIPFQEASNELFKLLENALKKRVSSNENIGMTLSGGFDSRVLLALTNEKIPTATFGIKNCRDNGIAVQVAKQNGNPHAFYELNDKNWFRNRIKGVWHTDGMFNVMHMHAAPFLNDLHKLFSINLNGFSGDLSLGGGWINKTNEKITLDTARKKFPGIDLFPDIDDPFYDLPHEDPFFINHRVVRFTNGGSILLSNKIEQRKPFFDNDLMDYIYSLPDEYRINGQIYKDLIINNIPSLFTNIATTHNVFPLITKNRLLFSCELKLKHQLMKTGLMKNYVWRYTDYNKWFNSQSFKEYLRILFKNPLSWSFNELKTKKEVPCINNSNSIEGAFIKITVELWLRLMYDEEIPEYIPK